MTNNGINSATKKLNLK